MATESQGSAPAVEYVGPFEGHRVVVDGWQVPLLSAEMRPGGQITLTLDDRFDLDLPVAEADRIVAFIANAVSVALGYASHPGAGAKEPTRLAPVRPKRLLQLDWSESKEASG